MKNEKFKKENIKNEEKCKMQNKQKQKQMKNAKSLKMSTQNPRRFPGFVVVVINRFEAILDEFHVVFQNVSISRRNPTTNLGVLPLFQGKGT